MHVARFLSFRNKSIAYAVALDKLALAFGRVGDHKKQKEMLERLQPILKRVSGPEDVAVAATLNNLGNVFGELGDHQKQKELLHHKRENKKRKNQPYNTCCPPTLILP